MVWLAAGKRPENVMRYQLATKRLYQILTAAIMLPEEIRLWRVLFRARHRGIIESAFHFPASRPVAYKHLGCYLATGFSASDRAAIVRHTYNFFEGLRSRSLDFRLCRKRPVWSLSVDETEFTVWIGPSSLAPKEGEAALTFTSNDQTLFTMSFSVSPGRLVGVTEADAIVIGGLQGAPVCRNELRDASRKLHEIAPQDLLVVAVRALARVLNINAIVGVPSNLHVAKEWSETRWEFDYDGLWERAGGVRTDRGFFVFSPDVIDRPLTANSASHRSRARRKRRLKLEIQAQMETRFRICFSPKPNLGYRASSFVGDKQTACTSA